MSWTDEPVPAPQRPEDELLADVQRRAATIRRRRRAGLSAGLGGVVVILLVSLTLARTGDDRASQLRVVGGDDTTTTSVAPATTVAPLPSTSAAPAPVTTTTGPRTATSPTTRTTLRPTTTRATTTTSTVPPPLRLCDAADVVITATPDRPSYPADATVSVLAAGVNRSSRPCQPYDPTVEFRNAAGALLAGLSVTDIFTMSIEGQPEPSWDPGETLSVTMPLPLRCTDTGGLCPPGTYTATAVFGPFHSPPAAFTLT